MFVHLEVHQPKPEHRLALVAALQEVETRARLAKGLLVVETLWDWQQPFYEHLSVWYTAEDWARVQDQVHDLLSLAGSTWAQVPPVIYNLESVPRSPPPMIGPGDYSYSIDRPTLDKLGAFLLAHLWNKPLDDYTILEKGRWGDAPAQLLETALQEFTAEQRTVVRKIIMRILQSALHSFLFALQERGHFEDDIHLLVNGWDAVGLSDGIYAEPFNEDGWIARFSTHGQLDEW
jgi:hypothetical protein